MTYTWFNEQFRDIFKDIQHNDEFNDSGGRVKIQIEWFGQWFRDLYTFFCLDKNILSTGKV